MRSTGENSGFLRFALALYRSPGVSPACLLLQDRCGVDVNVALLAVYLGAHCGRGPTAADLNTAGVRVRSWQEDVVSPLRRVRRRLADGPDPAPTAATAALRDHVKDVELEAEMVELEYLSVIAATFPVSAEHRSAEAVHQRVASAVGLLLEAACTTDEQAAIDVIASAAVRLGRM